MALYHGMFLVSHIILNPFAYKGSAYWGDLALSLQQDDQKTTWGLYIYILINTFVCMVRFGSSTTVTI